MRVTGETKITSHNARGREWKNPEADVICAPGLYASVTGRREMLFSKSHQVPAGVGRVTLRKTSARASCLPRRDFFQVRRDTSPSFRATDFEEKIVSRRKSFSPSLSPFSILSLSLYLVCRESCRNFSPNDFVRGRIRKRATT